MVTGLLSLSVELVVEILSYLDHYDLISCRQVRTRNYALSTSLLLHIALRLASGLELSFLRPQHCSTRLN